MTACTRAELEALDEVDPLRRFRQRFVLPEGIIYLDGNSLGAMPRATPGRVTQLMEHEWGQDLIRSWLKHGWIDLQVRVGAKIGRLIGASDGETIVADSTSVNVFKLLAAALKLRAGRRIIVSETGNFPTDLYIAQGLAGLLGQACELRVVEAQDVEQAITSEVAVVMLTHVNYRTGRMWDMARLTARAHRAGALMLWDLAHSAGAVRVDVSAANVDFAVGCGYKYLNGGPGAPAFLYIAKQHQDRAAMPLTGWFGHANPFAFEQSYRPAEGIGRAAVGTPPVLSLIALEVGVDVLLEASIDEVRAKSLRQAEVFAALMAQHLAHGGFTLVSPTCASLRGSQICFAHPHGWPIMQALIARGVIGDFRSPDTLRFGLTPLYLGYAELWDAVAVLKDIMVHRSWDQPEYHLRGKVT